MTQRSNEWALPTIASRGSRWERQGCGEAIAAPVPRRQFLALEPRVAISALRRLSGSRLSFQQIHQVHQAWPRQSRLAGLVVQDWGGWTLLHGGRQIAAVRRQPDDLLRR